MAYQSLIQDTLIAELEGKIAILHEEKNVIQGNLLAELSNEREINQELTEKFTAQANISQVSSEEIAYLRKKERKARRQRNVAVVVGVLLLGLAAVK